MDYKLLLIQGLGTVGTIVFLVSYQFKKNKNLFKAQAVSYIIYSIHFFLLGAYTGALCSIVSLMRAYFLSSDNKKLHSKAACFIVCCLQMLVGLISFDGLHIILPIIANVALTIAGYTNNLRKIRFVAMIINSPLWIAYDVIVGSWAGVIDELVTESSIIISIFRYKFNNKEDIIK